ncbi:HD domain-containing protein [Nonomuraea sp. NPDC050680]|uniref:HD domain-containing protein n=1 Tax=Nonomuraea sp. NPDC050680 TaxID=3154630 RepID=UPI0033D600AB
MAEELSRLTGLLYEVGLLKRYKRTGWLVAGVRDPESIADHSFRTAIIASVITALEGGNPERAAFLSLFHDTQETRVTDIPYIGKRYLKAAPNEEVTADQVRGVPEPVAEMSTSVRGAGRLGGGVPRIDRPPGRPQASDPHGGPQRGSTDGARLESSSPRGRGLVTLVAS